MDAGIAFICFIWTLNWLWGYILWLLKGKSICAGSFEEIKKYGLLNPVIGKRYVECVLSKGGSKDPDILLNDFLGREPSNQAFIGISSRVKIQMAHQIYTGKILV